MQIKIKNKTKFFSLGQKEIFLIIFFTFFIYLLVFLFIFPADSDIKLYFNYASEIIEGKVPYKDFFVVYPPLALISFVLPRLFTKDLSFYNFLFGLEMIIFFFLTIYIASLLARKINYPACKEAGYPCRQVCFGDSVPDDETSRCSAAKIKEKRQLIILHLLWLSIFLSYVLLKRFDIFVVFLTVFSIYLLFEKKYKLSAFFLACSVLAKFYPIIFLPLYFLYILKKENKKSAVNFSGFFFLFLVLLILPLLLIAPPQNFNWYSFSYHFTRPIHCESLYGSILLLLEKTKISLFQLTLKNDVYGWSIYSSLSKFILPASTILILLIFLLAMFKFWKEKKLEEKSFLKYILFFLLIFITFNRVLSPQFLIWVFPFFPFVVSSKDLHIVFLITALTFLIYPFSYISLIKKETWILILLFLRNFLLILMIFKIISKSFIFEKYLKKE